MTNKHKCRKKCFGVNICANWRREIGNENSIIYSYEFKYIYLHKYDDNFEQDKKG